MEECDVAFRSLKKYMGAAHILSKQEPGKTLGIYPYVSSFAVNLVLVREIDTIKRVVYYVSQALIEAETRYLVKLALALIVSAQLLGPYFPHVLL